MMLPWIQILAIMDPVKATMDYDPTDGKGSPNQISLQV